MTNQDVILQNKKSSGDIQIIWYVLFTVFALFGTYNMIFAVLNFLLCIVVLAQNDRVAGPFLVYATFFASIFKIPSLFSTSLFTIVLLLYVAKKLFTTRKIYSAYFLVLLLFFALTMATQVTYGKIDVNRNIKFFTNFLYMYVFISNIHFDEQDGVSIDTFSVFRSFIAGVLVSSVMRFFDGDFFRISDFVTEVEDTLGIGKRMYTRFSGLYGDPNYYAINAILALTILVFLFSKKRIKTVPFVILFGIFTALSVLTRSKSAFLMLIVPLVLLFYANIKSKNLFFQIVLVLGVAVIVYLSFSNRIMWFDSVTARLRRDTNLNSMTTGRVELWESYMDYFKSNPKKLIFGSGISEGLLHKAGAHNTYVDILYYLGILPGCLFITLIIQLMSFRKIKHKRDILNFGALIVVGIMYFFLSSLFDIDLNTNIILITIMFNGKNELFEEKNGLVKGELL